MGYAASFGDMVRSICAAKSRALWLPDTSFSKSLILRMLVDCAEVIFTGRMVITAQFTNG